LGDGFSSGQEPQGGDKQPGSCLAMGCLHLLCSGDPDSITSELNLSGLSRKPFLGENKFSYIRHRRLGKNPRVSKHKKL